MSKQAPRIGTIRIIRNHLSKIVFILRTRNTYGYNSVCMRIFMLFSEGARTFGKA